MRMAVHAGRWAGTLGTALQAAAALASLAGGQAAELISRGKCCNGATRRVARQRSDVASKPLGADGASWSVGR